MNPVEKNSLLALADAVKPKKNDTPETDTDTIADFLNKLLAEPDKKSRKQLIKDFSARRSDVAKFLKDNEELINAEAEIALISAATGSMHTEHEISYKGGRKSVTTKTKKVLPNAALLTLLLKNRMPDKYSDKPIGEIEIEDVSDIEKELYDEEDNSQD